MQRLSGLLGPLPAARTLAAEGAEVVAARTAEHLERARELGFVSGLGPVLDVGAGPAIGDRSYSDDPEVVAEIGLAVVDALLAVDVVPVVKHFPGHGRADADSHLEVATAPPLEELRAVDLVPFEAVLSTHDDVAVMVAHLDVPGLTDDGRPTSLSPAAVDGLLRAELGFDGVVMSDSLAMRAVTDRWPQPEAAVLALDAGVDVLLLGEAGDPTPTASLVVEAVVAAVAEGRLARIAVDDSLTRVLELRGRGPCRVVADRSGSPSAVAEVG